MAAKKTGKKKKKHLASLQDPTIEAIAEGMFRFAAQSQAISLMQRLSEQYAIARDQDPLPPGGCPTLKLWIRDFEVTKDEASKGFKGNFVRVQVKGIAEDKYTLVAQKLSLPLTQHPHSERPKRRHPNNGHPVIRAAQRNKVFPEIEQARLALIQMHEEFPETSIPGRDKLHVLLYSRQYKPPIRKVTIRVVPAEGGNGYRFDVSDNVRKPKEEMQEAVSATTEATPKPEKKKVDGKFTSLVALSRKKKPIKSKSDKK